MHISFTAHNSMLGSSSAGVFDYLDKENEEREFNYLNKESQEDLYNDLLDKENINSNEKEIILSERDNLNVYIENQNRFFSNNIDEFFTNSEACEMIDNNLSDRHNKNSSAFFMLNVSPSKHEIEHLKKIVSEKMKEQGMNEKFIHEGEKTIEGRENLERIKNDLMHQILRDYSREVMKEYAQNFGREIYNNPTNLPNQTEERAIYKEIKQELEDRKIEKINPEYTSKFEERKKIELEKLNLKEADLTKTEKNTLSSNLKKSLEKEGIFKLNSEYQNEFTRLKIEKAEKIGKDFSTRKLTEKDLVWFAKVEENRTYKPTDRWVQENKKISNEINKIEDKSTLTSIDKMKIQELKNTLHKDRSTDEIVREGMKKGGDQYHVHIVVSRYDNNPNKRHKMSLSPLSHKKEIGATQADNLRKEGFNRDQFFQKIESKFDQKYNFQRSYSKTYENFRNRNSTIKLDKIVKGQAKNLLKKPVNMIKNEVLKASGLNELSKINPLQHIPLSIPTTPMQAVKSVVKLAKRVIDLGR